jgi:hypothetical protein
MTPRERLTEILSLSTTQLLEDEGFKFTSKNSQYIRTVNRIKQIIYFEGSKWNYADAVTDYRLLCRIEIKDFPTWYIENYKTNQATHHQTKVTPKSIHSPSPSEPYNENWDKRAQASTLRYDLLNYTSEEVSESILHNIKECILPHLNDCSTYTGIADKAKMPLDKFDFYMMDKNLESAKAILMDLKSKIDNLDISSIDISDDFRLNSLKNTFNLYNIRIERFFPELDKVSITL